SWSECPSKMSRSTIWSPPLSMSVLLCCLPPSALLDPAAPLEPGVIAVAPATDQSGQHDDGLCGYTQPSGPMMSPTDESIRRRFEPVTSPPSLPPPIMCHPNAAVGTPSF
ncbi:hypothetical protein Vafri_18342, partial [Volvox africanus]